MIERRGEPKRAAWRRRQIADSLGEWWRRRRFLEDVWSLSAHNGRHVAPPTEKKSFALLCIRHHFSHAESNLLISPNDCENEKNDWCQSIYRIDPISHPIKANERIQNNIQSGKVYKSRVSSSNSWIYSIKWRIVALFNQFVEEIFQQPVNDYLFAMVNAFCEYDPLWPRQHQIHFSF